MTKAHTKAKKFTQKNKKLKTLAKGLALLLALAGTLVLSHQLYVNNKHSYNYYKGFGIALPNNYGIHGIDISHHNGTINWAMVRGMNVRGITINFAFIKATQGTTITDKNYNYNATQAHKVGIPTGAYHYFTEGESGVAQAHFFIQKVGKLLPGNLPPVLDIEQNNNTPKEALCTQALLWLNTVENYYNVKPILYTYVGFYKFNMAHNTAFNNYPLWIAHYTQATQPTTGRAWHLWQHSERGRVSGINTAVDFNVYNGDYLSFQNLLLH